MGASESKLKRVMKDIFAQMIACLPLSSLADPQYFSMWEKKGVHITADHCYSPVPRLCDLKADFGSRENGMAAVELNEAGQLDLLKVFHKSYSREYRQFSRDQRDTKGTGEYYLNNPFFGPVDAEILYCMVRHFKPGRMIEIGSGFSTYLSAMALEVNRSQGGHQGELTAIECYPNDTLKKGVKGLTRLIEERVENLDLNEFSILQENDILFIDSSHTLRVGGDVQYLFLDVLPRLKSGVLVHVHDIFFPRDYPEEWILKNNFFWAEQYLLQAFLAFNRDFEVLWCGNLMHRSHPGEVAAAFSSYRADGGLLSCPKSFWMRKIS